MGKPKKEKEQRYITAKNDIGMFFHCRQCLASIPDGESPSSWARLSVGFTPIGLQVWCNRHDLNVAHIDFQDQTHPANLKPHREDA